TLRAHNGVTVAPFAGALFLRWLHGVEDGLDLTQHAPRPAFSCRLMLVQHSRYDRFQLFPQGVSHGFSKTSFQVSADRSSTPRVIIPSSTMCFPFPVAHNPLSQFS